MEQAVLWVPGRSDQNNAVIGQACDEPRVDWFAFLNPRLIFNLIGRMQMKGVSPLNVKLLRS